jgi:hypothetical protein
LPHGARVFGTVRCVNNVELKTEAISEPILVSHLPPSVDSMNIHFITDVDNRIADSSGLQRDVSSLKIQWSSADDVFGIHHYECRVTQAGELVVNWTPTGSHTYAAFNNLQLEDGATYTAEVKAVDVDQRPSSVRNASILVDSRAPSLTGTNSILDNKTIPYTFNSINSVK